MNSLGWYFLTVLANQLVIRYSLKDLVIVSRFLRNLSELSFTYQIRNSTTQLMLILIYWTGLSSLGVPGVPWHTQILADQLTLFQPGGTDYTRLITTGTPGFSDLPTALQNTIWIEPPCAQIVYVFTQICFVCIKQIV